MKLDRTSPPAPGPIRAFEFPTVERSRLTNGLTLLIARRGELPLVTVRAVLNAGAAGERPGEEGLAWLTAHALEGGTAQRGGAELAWELERLGAQLETWTSWDAVNVALTTRSDRLPDALALLAEVLRAPAFPAREVARLRNEQLAEIMRRSTEPRGLADDAAARCIYADEAAYARPVLGLAHRIGAFGPGHAATFHARLFAPDAAGLVVVGAVESAAVVREAEAAFGDWAGAAELAPPVLATPRNDRTTIYLVDRPSAVQSELRIGHVGVPRDHDDYYALLVLNTLLGGAFTSRLNLNLREKHGFTYGVRSGFSFRRGAGPFVVHTAVASDVTARAITETLNELHAVRDGVITDDEVYAARHFLAGTLPLSMQTTEQVAARIAEVHTYALDADYLEKFRHRIEAVGVADVAAAARRHLHLHRLAITVVGNADAIADDLRALGIGEIVRHEVRADAPAGAG
jgi:zinc protease